MSLKNTILGFLSWKPLTGYELKKYFIETDFIHWSGNNNQIYKSLVELHNNEFVTKEVIQQENYPAKKVYQITQKGLDAIAEWSLKTPDTPQIKNVFLMQLAWSSSLKDTELENLIGEYQYNIEMKLAISKEKLKRKVVLPDRTKREALIWEMLWKNIIGVYQNELNWITKLRSGLNNK